MEQSHQQFIKEYYSDLAIVSLVNDWDLTPSVKDIVAQLHPDTMKRYYGSGFIIPEHIEGKHILDIGCGSGSLVFILSKLVGPTGSVIGTDLTPKLIEECKRLEDYYREKWGYDKKNTDFFVGDAEDISQLQDQSFDIVVSNGMICLLKNKEKGFTEAFRVLKDGGEFFLSDIYSLQTLPEEFKDDAHLWNYGVGRAQLVEDFHTCAKEDGFTIPYLTGVAPVKLNEEYTAKLPGRRFLGAGSRLFRLGGATKRGPASVTYKGKIKGHESEFKWDVNLTFKTGQAVKVDGDLATILANTRYRDVFDIADASGTPTTHRAQNPFVYLDYLSSQHTTLPDIYVVE